MMNTENNGLPRITEKVAMLRLTFQIVDPRQHSQYYCETHRQHPCTDPATVPDEHWKTIDKQVVADDQGREQIYDQYRGLVEMIPDGELVRNPRVWAATVTWEQILPG